jgi:hypothetical protein
MVRKIISSAVLLCVLAIACGTVTRAAEFEGVQAGTDWFVHLPGTFVVVNGTTVPMMGNPAFPGGPSMIVRRLLDMVVADVVNSQASTSTMMTLLSLKSTAPVNFGGTFFDVYADLDPGHTTTGSLTFTQTVAGEGTPEGTFTSFFDVFFDIDLTPAGQPKAACVIGANCTAAEQPNLNGSGSWTDDTANGVYLVGQANYAAPTMNMVVTQITTPEPASLLLVGAGLAGLLALVKWRRT